VDCYFHTAVPSVATCRECSKTICATCRDSQGLCPSCRLDERMKARAAASRKLTGAVGPSNPGPLPPPPRRTVPAGALATVSPEMRAMLALGYPLWPLAALSLLGPRKSPAVYRQAVQALAFNFGSAGLYFALAAVAHIPLIGLSALPLIAMILPVWLVASVVYGFKLWSGDDVRVPIVSDWLDEREAHGQTSRAA
jgi:Domain of unknown function (DUF4870)